MKDCICTIFLLTCGLILSAYPTQTEGNCIFNDEILDVGFHTTYPCMRVFCKADGSTIAEGCPEDIVHRACPLGSFASRFLPDTDSPFPECCFRVICTPYPYTYN